MLRISLSPEGVLGFVLLLVLSIQACIVVVDDDAFDDLFYDEALYHTHWHLDVLIYHGQTYNMTGRVYTLSFDSRSRLSGAADCNDYGAGYGIPRQGRLVLNDLHSTDAACGTASLDVQFLDALAEAHTYALRDGRLTIASQNNDLILYFNRD